MFAGGQFRSATFPSRIAKWSGTNWLPLGAGMNNAVNALVVYDDGTGPALYAGGSFTVVDGSIPANRLAKWDGVSWAPLADGVNNTVNYLLPFDDGTGPALFICGAFTTAGGMPSHRIAKWFRPVSVSE